MSPSAIRIISTTTFHAQSTTNTPQTIPLTPWDLRLLNSNPIQMGLLFTKPQHQDIVSHLKNSLSTTLTSFPPLAGRLETETHDNSTTVSYHITCNNHGAMFVHATAEDVKVGDIMHGGFVPSVVYDFFTLNGTQNCDGTKLPLLGVQVTELHDGVFLACTMNHAVVDGDCFWHFFNCWAEISRGMNFLSKPPVMERKFIRHLYSEICVPTEQINKQPQQFYNIKEKVYHYSKKSISKIKDRANYEAAGPSISSLQAVLAHLWRAVIRNTKNLDHDTELTYRLPIGIRQRMKTILHENYFGCAVQGKILGMKARELLEKGLGHAAMQLNKMVISSTEENCKEFFESWIENPELARYDSSETKNMHATMVTINSPRFDVYGNDFGWGKPLAARSGISYKGDRGVVTLYPGVEEDGSMDIGVCVLIETLEAMEMDTEFMEAFKH